MHRRVGFGIVRSWAQAAVPAVLLAFLVLVASSATAAPVRIKDIANFEGVRENVLIGYGLVTGLNGTGDNLRSTPFTAESLVAMLERLGVNIRDQSVRTRNVAAVMVTATLPPFRRQGSRIDINVSAMGDAKSLLGGQLLPTPLRGANGQVYALAQGGLVSSGFAAEGDAESVTVGVPTAARVPGGATVELEIPFELDQLDSIKVALKNPDFTTAVAVADAINAALQRNVAIPLDSGTIEVDARARERNMAFLIARIENLIVNPDTPATVVVDDRTGTIVMNENVRIGTVAVSHGNLTVRVQETPQVSQPNPFGEGETVVVPRTNIDIDTSADNRMAVVQESPTLNDLVASLNALGVGPRDLIAILQAIKSAGALHAELVVQ